MPAAVPAIPPNPKIAAIIAITKNVNAHPNINNPYAIKARCRKRVYSYFAVLGHLYKKQPWGSHLLLGKLVTA